jgi:4-hydroxy 2-oxovalerate aldolase
VKTLLLDCTLRDGGYYTNWDFDKSLVAKYFQAMENLPIQYVEIGYRSKPLKGYFGEYFYCPEYVMRKAKELMPSKKLAIMLNEKDTIAQDLEKLLVPCKTYIQMVRLAVSPERIPQAAELAQIIKKMGFEVAFNIMYLSKFASNEAILEGLKGLEQFVDFLYLVDSYGGVFPEQVQSIIQKVKTKTTIPLGFHGHNNLELVMINSITAMEAGVSILDATITGMGRGAGNLKTELFLTYLAFQKGVPVDFNALSSTVEDFEKMQKQYEWGTSLPYMVAGANSLPQKDVMEWMSKKRFSISGLVNALKNQKNPEQDTEFPILKTNKAKKAVIIGGGNSISEHQKGIEEYLNKNPDTLIIFSTARYAHLFNHLGNQQFVALVGNEGHRLNQIFAQLSKIPTCVLSPRPRKMGVYVPDSIANKALELEKITFSDKFHDSPLAVSIQIALNHGVDSVYLVGFDGYNTNIDPSKFELLQENQYLLDKLLSTHSNVESWTLTNYKNVEQVSLFAYLG